MTGCQGAPHGRQAGRGGGEPSRWRGCLGRLQGDTEVKAVTLSSPDCKGLDQTRLQQYSVRTFCPSRPGLPALQYTWETPNLILPMKASGTHSPGGQLPGTPHSRSIRQRRKCWQGGHNEHQGPCYLKTPELRQSVHTPMPDRAWHPSTR